MKKLTLIIGLFCFAFAVEAQPYNTAAGLRLGKQAGLSLDQRIANNVSIEAMAITNFKTKSTVAVLAKFHNRILFRGLHYYAGAGVHKSWDADLHTAERDLTNPAGITGVGGLAMNIGKVNLALDYKPAINIVGGEQLVQSQVGFSVRYVFSKPERKKLFRRK